MKLSRNKVIIVWWLLPVVTNVSCLIVFIFSQLGGVVKPNDGTCHTRGGRYMATTTMVRC